MRLYVKFFYVHDYVEGYLHYRITRIVSTHNARGQMTIRPSRIVSHTMAIFHCLLVEWSACTLSCLTAMAQESSTLRICREICRARDFSTRVPTQIIILKD